MNEKLLSLLPKAYRAKIQQTPEEKREEAQDKLREYFRTFHKRKAQRPSKFVLKYTLFLEPAPYLTLYREGDEELPMKKVIYTSFRKAYRKWMNELKDYKRECSLKRKASLLT